MAVTRARLNESNGRRVTLRRYRDKPFLPVRPVIRIIQGLDRSPLIAPAARPAGDNRTARVFDDDLHVCARACTRPKTRFICPQTALGSAFGRNTRVFICGPNTIVNAVQTSGDVYKRPIFRTCSPHTHTHTRYCSRRQSFDIRFESSYMMCVCVLQGGVLR